MDQAQPETISEMNEMVSELATESGIPNLAETNDAAEQNVPNEQDSGSVYSISLDTPPVDRTLRARPIYHLAAPATMAWRLKVLHVNGPGDQECVAIYDKAEPFDCQVSEPAARAGPITNGSREETINSYSSDDTTAFLVETEIYEQGFVDDNSNQGRIRFGNGVYPGKFDLGRLRITSSLPTKMLITSECLDLALRYILVGSAQYPDGFHERSPFVSEPYICFMHHYERIDQFAEGRNISVSRAENNEEIAREFDKQVAIKHVKALRDFLKSHYDKTFIPISRAQTTSDPSMITIDMVWYFFPSGRDVYVRSAIGSYASVVRKVYRRTKGRKATWVLELWHLATDGNRIARVPGTVKIDHYEGAKDIRSLPVCPASVWDIHDNMALRKHLIQRSKLLLSALQTGSLHVRYDGPDQLDGQKIKGNMVVDYRTPSSHDKRTMGYQEPSFDSPAVSHSLFESYDYIYFGDRETPTSASRYVPEDEEIYSRRHAYWRTESSPSPSLRRARKRHEISSPERDYDYDEYRRSPEMQEGRSSVNPLLKARYATTNVTEHQLLLLNPVAPAFSLSTKQWHLIHVDFMQVAAASGNSINHLVMEGSALDTIRALASRRQKRAESWSVDYIEGKGAGQIILLHGPPGVGKTFTVECIAEWLQRPLLALTVADIGTEEMRVEQELMKWFDLAESWEAVLLVDEADIFLEQRKTRDLARNGLVTALLRRMEYFKGLLFLTTNRVGHIDDAFMSRVHTAIEYKSLDSEARSRIWNGFFDKLNKEQRGKIIVGPSAKKYVEERKAELNGREIRNALQTAITLATFQAEQDSNHVEGDPVIVERDHFKDVLDMSENFHKYVDAIRNEDATVRAYRRGERAILEELSNLVTRGGT